MASTDDDNGNGKVTLAVLGIKLDRLISDVDELKKAEAERSRGCIEMTKQVTTHEQQIKDNSDEIDRLRTQSTVWNLVNSIAAGAASVFGLRS